MAWLAPGEVWLWLRPYGIDMRGSSFDSRRAAACAYSPRYEVRPTYPTPMSAHTTKLHMRLELCFRWCLVRADDG